MKDYNKFKERNSDCFIPEEHICNTIIANTPEWLRRYAFGYSIGQGEKTITNTSEVKDED